MVLHELTSSQNSTARHGPRSLHHHNPLQLCLASEEDWTKCPGNGCVLHSVRGAHLSCYSVQVLMNPQIFRRNYSPDDSREHLHLHLRGPPLLLLHRTLVLGSAESGNEYAQS